MKMYSFLTLIIFGLSFSATATIPENNIEETTEATTETTTDADTSNNIENVIDETTEFEITYVDGNEYIDMTISDFKATIQNESELYGSLNYDEAFQLMKNSLNAGEDISLTEAFALSGGLTIPDNFMYDLSETGLTGELDTTKLNYEYGNLISNMNNNFSSTNLMDLSIGATNLFNAQYGDLANELKLEPSSLPEDFNISELINNNNDTINNLYSSAYKDKNFASIRSTIDVSGIFDKAALGVTEYQLTDINELNSTLNTLSEGYRNNTQEKKEESINQMNQQITALANNQLDIRNYVDEYYVDMNGNLVTPDMQVDDLGNSIEDNILEQYDTDTFGTLEQEVTSFFYSFENELKLKSE